MHIKAFHGIRPAPGKTAEVVCPPYDVINSAEAAELAKGKPLSFLHVIKPEISLPEGTELYSDAVYAAARENLSRLLDEGALVRDPSPSLYIYRQKMGDHVQTGVVGAASVDEYDQDLIKKHEYTRPNKEDDRTRHVDTTSANAGPVFLTYRAHRPIDRLIASLTQNPPDVEASHAGVQHWLWCVTDPQAVSAIEASFAEIPCSYVADGHHRSASASRVRANRRDRAAHHTGMEDYNRFLAVIFPDEQLAILPYNRVVRDLNGLDPNAFLAAVKTRFDVDHADDPRPATAREFCMYLSGSWYRLRIHDALVDRTDPVASLDVALLQDNLLAPILAIGDPRLDERVDFVGGIRGTSALSDRVDGGKWAVAFSMHATTIEQLLKVADAGTVMPPKSTWFEPKLLSGLVTHALDGEGPA
jgi:uncharacterized protein (DUF1015 family)